MSHKRMEEENRTVYEFIPISRIVSNWRGADGVRVENFHRIHHTTDCRRDPENHDWNTVSTWAVYRTNHFLVNVYNDVVWREKGNNGLCIANSKNRCRICKKIRARTFLGPEDMMINFSESGHPVFRGSSAFERGSLRSKGGGTLSVHFCGDTDAVEVVLRTILSVNQLGVYEAVADMCDELASRISVFSESTGRLVAEDESVTMVLPKGLSTTTKPLLTNETVQRDWLREYERKFANLGLRRCGTGKIGWLMLRVYITPRWPIIQSKRIDPWKRRSVQYWRYQSVTTKAVTGSRSESNPHLAIDLIHGSWSKYVTENVGWNTQKKRNDVIEDSAKRLAAKARPKQTSMPMPSFSTVTIPLRMRKWIDVEPGEFDQSSFEVSKKMIRLLRHDLSVLREKDGAVEFKILTPMFRSEFTSQHWSTRTRLNYLQRGGAPKKRFSVLLGYFFCWDHWISSSTSRPFWTRTN